MTTTPVSARRTATRGIGQDAAAGEVARILEAMRRDYPEEVRKGRITQELADYRIEALEVAWGMCMCPHILPTPFVYREAYELAEMLIEARKFTAPTRRSYGDDR